MYGHAELAFARRNPPRSVYREKRILVSWYTDPGYIAPFVLSDRQTTVGPKVSSDQVKGPLDGFTPCGRYDLFAALEALHLPTQFDAIVVAGDATLTNLPLNLEAFDCPKILCVGDTQHFKEPIRNLIGYAKGAHYDFVLSANNRQHLHWFIEAGLTNVAWLPGLKVISRRRPFFTERKAHVCFFGRSGKFHVRRAEFLAEWQKREAFSLAVMDGTPDEAADAYANSAVSLNYSLNGDLNMRVFEVLSAGGCLLTDRLSKQSGLDLLLEEGKDFVGYDGLDECIDKARFLLNHPHTALAIARAGNAAFMSRLQPERRIEQLFDWVFRGRLDPLFRVRDFPRAAEGGPKLGARVRIYQQLQEIHRVRSDPAALVMSDVPEIHILDALDLRNFKFAIVDADGTAIRSNVPAIAERCMMKNLGERRWDCLIATDPETGQTRVMKTRATSASHVTEQELAAMRLQRVAALA